MGRVDDLRTFIYRIDAQDRITFVNREWVEFARENEASELTPENVLGQPLQRYISGWETRHLYELIYQCVREKGREVQVHFNCDSPHLRRSFRMRLFPLDRGALEFSIQVLEIKPVLPRPILDNTIEHSAEVVVICSWCKRIRIENGHWVEIADAMTYRALFGAIPPKLTHDVCEDCFSAIRRQLDDP